MASRYWVLGSGSWDATSTSHWSATSGGSSGASVPTSADDVFFNGGSGGGTVSLLDAYKGSMSCKSIDTRGFTGNFVCANNWCNLVVYNGSVNLSGGTFGEGVQLSLSPSVAGTYTINLADKPTWFNAAASSGVTFDISGLGNSRQVTLQGTGSPNTFNVTGNINVYDPAAQGGSFGLYYAQTVNWGSGTISARYIYEIGTSTVTGSRTATMSSSTQSILTGFQGPTACTGISSITITPSGQSVNLGAYRSVASGQAAHPTTYINNAGSNWITISGNTFGTIAITGSQNLGLSTTSGATIDSLSTDASCTTINLNNGSPVTISNWTINGPAGRTTVTGQGAAAYVTSNSYTFNNVKWVNVTAAGTIPWYGTNFEDGGSNQNIMFALPFNGLLFGSSF